MSASNKCLLKKWQDYSEVFLLDEYDCDRLKVDLEQDYDLIAHHINIEEHDIGEWDDDNPLNLLDCPKSECEKYFE